MNTYIKTIIEDYFDNQSLFEMANLSTDETDLPVVVWISIKPDENHKIPRIKFSNTESTKMTTDNLVPISISDNPKILSKNTVLNIHTKKLNKVKEWIIKNKLALLQVWNGEITPTQFVIKHMKKV